MTSAQNEFANHEMLNALIALTAQAAHDIRSPLSALSLITSCLDEVAPEKKEILKSATQKIMKIANILIEENKKFQAKIKMQSSVISVNEEPLEYFELGKFMTTALNEKKFEFQNMQNIEIEFQNRIATSHWVGLQALALARVISNLVNNAVESISENGKVDVQLQLVSGRSVIEISDTGCGIPANILTRVGTRSFSFGKKSKGSGSGLGLSYTKAVLKKWGGEFQIESILGQGTKVRLILPK